MPAARSRSSPPGHSTDTIAEFDGSSPTPARKRSASATSWAWIESTPTALSSSSAGSAPTHENQAGDVSSRRASCASRSGGPM
jgi:hypothetical protein